MCCGWKINYQSSPANISERQDIQDSYRLDSERKNTGGLCKPLAERLFWDPEPL